MSRLHVLGLIVLGSVISTTAQSVVMADPRNSKGKIENPEPVVVSVDAAGRLMLGEKATTLYRLRRTLKAAMDERMPPDRIVYIKAVPKVKFSQILGLLSSGRMIDQDTFGLVLDDGEVRDTSAAVITKIPLEKPSRNLKPNPLSLILSFQKNGQLDLNGETQTPSSLTKLLAEIFKAREVNGAYREGTNEVERTVFLAPKMATTFDALIQAARLLKNAGAEPIGIQIDKPQPMVVEINQIGQ